MVRARTQSDALTLLDRATRPIGHDEPLRAFGEVADRAHDVLGATHMEVQVTGWPPAETTRRFVRRLGVGDVWEVLGGTMTPTATPTP